MEFDLPTQDRADQHPAEIAFVIQRIQVRGHHISSVRLDTVVWPLQDGSGCWHLGHVC
jgi:hypothetical protein